VLELDETTVETLKEQISCDDTLRVREICSFRKNAEKYPLVYKEQIAGQPYPESVQVEYAAICLESPTNMHSLLLKLVDGRWTRICSAYLNEMQADNYSMPEDLSMEALSDDDLFA
jgi:hypothetical protein